jgi:iron complex outermembrane receptor protein
VPVGSSQVIAIGNGTSPDLDPSDLARIEVLKGPQGTLYGADSLGGLIKYVTVDPSTSAFSARTEVGGADIPGGGTGYVVRGAANIPLSDTFAIRVSAFSRQDPGYIDDLTTRQANYNSVDVFGGRISALWRPRDDVSLKLSALVQNTNGDGSALVDSNVQGQFYLGDLKYTALPGSNGYHTNWQLYTATLSAKVSGIDLVSVTGYNTNVLHSYYDLTGSSYFTSTINNPQSLPQIYACSSNCGVVGENHFYTEKFTQELRLSASVGHWMDWLGGAFYTHESSPGSLQYNYATAIPSGTHDGVLGTYEFSPLTLSESAFFGDLTFHLTDRLDFELGGRQSWNKEFYSPYFYGPEVSPLYGVAPGAPYVQRPGRSSGSAFTYLATSTFHISHDLMLYGRIATGYRIGGPNLNAGVGIYETVPFTYKPDKTTNYELGMKGNVLDHQLSFDVSVYYIAWKDFQLGAALPNYATFTTNAGDAKSEGVEASVEWHPLATLTLAAQGSYDYAILTQNMPADVLNDGIYGLAGERLPYSIPYSVGLTITQDIPLPNNWTAFLGGSVTYVGTRQWELPSYQGAYRLTLPDYTQANIRLGARRDSWLVNLYVNNVGDRRGIVGEAPSSATNYGNPGQNLTTIIQPRTVGLNLSRSF